MTPDLSVKLFLLAFGRFISRCSIAENIISNNFKTFEDVEDQHFMPYLRIQRNFLLENSSWWGRFCERMVCHQTNIRILILDRHDTGHYPTEINPPGSYTISVSATIQYHDYIATTEYESYTWFFSQLLLQNNCRLFSNNGTLRKSCF